MPRKISKSTNKMQLFNQTGKNYNYVRAWTSVWLAAWLWVEMRVSSFVCSSYIEGTCRENFSLNTAAEMTKLMQIFSLGKVGEEDLKINRKIAAK